MGRNTHYSASLDAKELPPANPAAKPGAARRVFAIAALAAFALSLTYAQSANITAFYLHRQDRWLLLLGFAALGLCGYRLTARTRLPAVTAKAMLAAAAVLFAITLLGHDLLLAGYDRTRDEQMASFDAAVFAGGHLVARLPALWGDHAGVLNDSFMYPAEQRSAWISSYLPLNAAMRALLGTIATPALAGPLMTALGALALWGCVRRIWPQDTEAVTVALVLYAGSAQVLVTGMTSYAMPAHLALNLCWLWLFLRGSWRCDLAALGVGFVATGLHQPLMHPMFAAPILFLLVRDRRWDRAALYFAGYAAIGAFWLWWPNLIWQMVQADPAALRPAGVDFMTRMAQVLGKGDPLGLPNMVSNLLRMIAWQHLLLVPLALIGARVARKDPLAGALAGGLILTIFVMAVLLPYQGHGFGYRYLHGLIGNAILLAIFGWRAAMGGQSAGQWRGLMWRATAVGGLCILPVQGWMAHAFYAPPAQVSARIDTIDADYAVIGAGDARDAYDLIYNPPALDRRPVRIMRNALDRQTIADICASRPTVALVDNGMLQPLADFYGSGTPKADAANARIAPKFLEAGCRMVTPTLP